MVEVLLYCFFECYIYECFDVVVCKKEGLDECVGVLYGELLFKLVVIEENGVKISVDIVGGYKMGFYLD